MNESLPKQKVRRPKNMTVTGTAELVLAPKVRRFAARLYIGAAAVVLVLAVAAVVAVRYLAVVEPMLAAEGVNAARAIAYELPAGGELHVPIEPNTDLLRFIVHAYGPSDMPLTVHPARISIDVRGDKKQRKEELNADLSGLRSRVTPESDRSGVGDPMPFEVDVHDAGVGEVVIKLAEIKNAKGVLIRAYRREQLTDSEVALRNTSLDRAKKDQLARWTWELGWDELAPAERLALLHARWKRVGALRGAGVDLKSTTIAVAPPPLHESRPAREELLGRVALRGDEAVAVIMHAHTVMRFISDEATVLTATTRDLANVSETKSQAGSVELGPFEGPRSVELRAARDVLLEVRSSSANDIEWLGYATVWRVSATRPVIITSPEQSRAVRVSIRKPLRRDVMGLTRLAATVEITGPGFAPIVDKWTADKARSRVDRYEEFDAPEAPSERAQFFVSLPRGSQLKITSTDGSPLDVSLAELDTDAPPKPMPERAPDAPAPVLIAETEDNRSVWVARRPSNATVFEDENARRLLRTAHWYAPAPPPAPPGSSPLAHAKHTDSVKIEFEGKDFDGITKPFDLMLDERRPLYVPIIGRSEVQETLTVSLERTPPGGIPAGVYQRWTLPRAFTVGPQEQRATFVIGDDIPANSKLRLRFVPEAKTPGARPLVTMPWHFVSNKPLPPPRWLAGGFEE